MKFLNTTFTTCTNSLNIKYIVNFSIVATLSNANIQLHVPIYIKNKPLEYQLEHHNDALCFSFPSSV